MKAGLTGSADGTSFWQGEMMDWKELLSVLYFNTEKPAPGTREVWN
jgi:hypothetical protein